MSGRGGRRGNTVRVVAGAGVLLAAVLLVVPAAEAQCAMCRTMLATPEGQRMIAALRSGILLLLAAPFAIFATIATLAVRSQRRRRVAGEAAATGASMTGDRR